MQSNFNNGQMPQQVQGVPQQQGNFSNNSQIGMVFHVIYSILLLISGGFSLISSIITMLSEGGLIMGLWALLGAIFTLLTGIFLLMRKKAGYVMRLINNILSFISAGMLIVIGVLLIVGGGIITTLLEGVEGASILLGMAAFLGIGVIIGAIIGIVITIIIINYYKKRKHMFY